ncbi:MAG: translation initiation factor IF-2 subunit beta [Candidatus Woesearchaeota archaeon]
MKEEEYLKLLEKAYSQIPQLDEASMRLKIPEVEAEIEGNKTLLRNIRQIAKIINRDPEHLLKYFMKKYATPGQLLPKFGVLNRKVPLNELDQVLKNYIDEFVICPVCKSPDTDIIPNGAYGTLKCKACGSKTTIKIKL